MREKLPHVGSFTAQSTYRKVDSLIGMKIRLTTLDGVPVRERDTVGFLEEMSDRGILIRVLKDDKKATDLLFASTASFLIMEDQS
jgi:hypothetical protein